MINHLVRVAFVTAWFVMHPFAIADSLPIDDLPSSRDVMFSRDIAPVLQRNCVACHNAKNEEGDVNLESANLRLLADSKWSDAEDVLVPGKPDESRLFLVASHADDPVMPPEDNDVSASVLNAVQLALLKRWIQSGAAVDQISADASGQTWQPLPPTMKTVFGSSMTPDGRLSAIGFGNQVRLFGAKSPNAIGSLEIGFGDQTKPAHDDFVQDLVITSDGRQVVSAGFRNVKLWEISPFEPVLIPEIDHDQSLAIAMNAGGSHVAVLSRLGELSVAEIGQQRWQWMKSFEAPDDFMGDHPPKIQLAVEAFGQRVAIGWGNQICIVRIDGKEPKIIDLTHQITSMRWRSADQLLTADSTGRVIEWKQDGGVWIKTEHLVFDHAILGLYAAEHDAKRLVATDAVGNVAIWNGERHRFDKAGKLPSPAVAASLTPDGTTLWMTTAKGTMGKYAFAEGKFTEVAHSDPVAEAQLAADQWKTLVGRRLVAVHDKDVKQAEANVTAEKKSIELFGKEIETKTKLRNEKQAALVEAEKGAEAATGKLAEAKNVEQARNKERKDLTASLKSFDAKISELESQLAKLKKEHAQVKTQLSTVPDAMKLSDAVKAATDASNKADQLKDTRIGELSNAAAALKRAEETKRRGETRLKGLDVELQRRRQAQSLVNEEQKKQEARQAASKHLQEQSRAVGKMFAVMSDGSRIVTRSTNSKDESSGKFSLWSGAGDWIAELAGIPVNGQPVAVAEDCVLIKTVDGNTHALKASDRLWRHRQTIGSSTGQSPFSDRVLSVDVGPAGKLLATGGGQPSRSGELMIWDLSNGSLVRAIDDPHEDTVLCVRFSPDGKTLVSAGADRMVKLWEVETGKLIKTLEGHTHHVTSIAWNVNCRQLASGSADETVKIWDVDSGQATRTISGIKTEVTGLDFVGADNRIGVVGGDGQFRIYRTDNGAREANAKVPGGYLYTLDSNREGSHFVTGGAEGVALVVDKAGKQKAILTSDAD